ncbi:hypothetical protein [Microbacterium sp. LWH12-1.2]|uniref:hypothetical protein n=1 Tax=Microbacterium sp. LWH12-1.2 TaxID=3135259 RepID=UPI0034239696
MFNTLYSHSGPAHSSPGLPEGSTNIGAADRGHDEDQHPRIAIARRLGISGERRR